MFRYLLFILFTISVYGQNFPTNQSIKILSLGDSYTIGAGINFNDTYPNQLADTLASMGFIVDTVAIVAKSGWTTTNLLNALNENPINNSFNFVTLLIGVNNEFQNLSLNTYKKEFEELLQMALQYAGNREKQVLVISIPDYYYTPFGLGYSQAAGYDDISERIDLFNNINLEIANDYNIDYLNITPISRKGLEQPELVSTDKLHPSAKMYKIWIDSLMAQATFSEIDTLVNVANYMQSSNKPVSVRLQDKVWYITNHSKGSALIYLYTLEGKLIAKRKIPASGQWTKGMASEIIICYVSADGQAFSMKLLPLKK